MADELAARSTVSRADTYAVLVELGDVLGQLMASGRSVKLKGVGTFYLTCQTKGKGTDTPEELTPEMITDVKVRFIPEYSRGHRKQITGRTMLKVRFIPEYSRGHRKQITGRTMLDKWLEWIEV